MTPTLFCGHRPRSFWSQTPRLLVTDATPSGHGAVPVWARKEMELALTGFCGMAHTRDHERRRHGRFESLKVWRLRATTKAGESGESPVGDCVGEATPWLETSSRPSRLPRRPLRVSPLRPTRNAAFAAHESPRTRKMHRSPTNIREGRALSRPSYAADTEVGPPVTAQT